MNERQRLLAGLAALLIVGASESPSTKAKNQPFAVKVVGSGRPMILIPGLMCSGDVWDGTVNHFKGKYECHVLTLAGFAGQPPVDGPFLDNVRKGIADYIRERKLQKPVIVGHSLGGFLCYALGSAEPDLPGVLVAVDGLPCLPAAFNANLDAETRKKQAEQIRERMEKAPRQQHVAQSKMMVKSWINDTQLRETVDKWCADSDQATVARAVGELFGADLRGDCEHIKAPLLLLGAYSKEMDARGLKREVVTKSYQDQVAKAPHHKVAIAEDARHFIMFDAPEWMYAQIEAFLDGK
jgi:pimeloyl-ACP methyl ester carboxylesterase